MKRKGFSLLILTIIILIGFLGCTKDQFLNPIEPVEPVIPTPTVEKYTIEAFVSKGLGGVVTPTIAEVEKGGSLTLTAYPEAGFKEDSVVVNGKSFPLTQNTYTISNITSKLKVEVKFKKTLSWFLLKNEWKLDSSSVYDLRSGILSPVKLWGVPGYLQYKLIFSSDGKVLIIQNGATFNCKWVLNESVTPPTLFVGKEGQENLPGSSFFRIDKLDENNLFLSKDGEYAEDSSHKSLNRDFYSH